LGCIFHDDIYHDDTASGHGDELGRKHPEALGFAFI
jgi:hypothetical protein